MYNYTTTVGGSRDIAALCAAPDSDIFLLGSRVAAENATDASAGREALVRAHFERLLWLTYRVNFKSIAGTAYQTDAGWGCMLRASQMLLANTLARHYAGEAHVTVGPSLQRQVLRWFEDIPANTAPYSIHRIALNGVRYGTAVGQWFGPQVACDVLRDVVRDHAAKDDIVVYVARDATIYRDELEALCTETAADACLILVPNRLGLERVNELYLPQLAAALALPQSLGLVGGRTNAARYVVGRIGLSALFLDPHVVQPVVAMDNDFELTSFHSRDVACMPLADLDPSLALAFYCRDALARRHLLEALQRDVCARFDFALLALADSAPQYQQRADRSLIEFGVDDLLADGAARHDDNDAEAAEMDDFEMM